MRNVLVTGGAGFLGSHLCEELIKHDDVSRVVCVDNIVTGSWSNVDHLIGCKKFKIYECDAIAASQIDWNWLGGLDEIYHLASPTSPVAINNYKEMTRKVNSIGTCALINLASKQKAKMLFVSSVKVYGECDRVSDYIFGKRVGEELCAHAGHKIARLASVYGPRMALNDSRVIPVFITRTLLGQPIQLWNGGNQVDSFCYVDDVVKGLVSYMSSSKNGVIEFGAENGITIAALAEKIMQLIGTTVPACTTAVNVSEECHKVVDINKARSALGWQPAVTLGEGLQLTINYFKEEMKKRRDL
jgi:nucleoside-diphosphate-sugar epimerase